MIPESDLELLSTRINEEAEAGYGISEDLLLSQQAEAIYGKYLEDCVEGIREQLKKQGQDEINATDRAMAEQLARLSETEHLEIQKAERRRFCQYNSKARKARLRATLT